MSAANRLRALGGWTPAAVKFVPQRRGKAFLRLAAFPSRWQKGSPATIAARTRPSGCAFLNARISSLVQRDCAASGEQRTIRQREASQRSADRIPRVPRSSEFISVPEDRAEPSGYDADGSVLLANERREARGIFSSASCSQSAQPPVLVAVAKEAEVMLAVRLRRASPQPRPLGARVHLMTEQKTSSQPPRVNAKRFTIID